MIKREGRLISDFEEDDGAVEEAKPARRPHRRTGNKPPGGRREGSGRPEGSTNALPMGAVQAIRTLNLRVPESAPELAKDIANRAFQRAVEVMEEQVDFRLAPSVLKAVTVIREEICGSVSQKHEVTGAGGGGVVIEVKKYGQEDAQ